MSVESKKAEIQQWLGLMPHHGKQLNDWLDELIVEAMRESATLARVCDNEYAAGHIDRAADDLEHLIDAREAAYHTPTEESDT